MFYSPRIRDVDYGLKITGKQGTTNLGFLSTGSYTGSKQYANLASFDNELGTYSSYGGTFLNSHQTGGLGGEVIQLRGQYGWANGANKVRFFGNVTESNLDNGKKGQSVFAMLRSNGGQGRLQGGIFYGSTTKDFDNPLGLVNNPDAKGIGFNAHRFDIQTKGKIENKSYYFGGNTYNHIDGTFFSDNYYGGMENSLRNGFGYGISASIGKREAFHDQVLSPFLSWNQKSLLSGGKFSVDFGHQQNKPYQFTSVSQGFPVGKAFSLNLNFGQARIGTETNWQGILSGTYRIDPLQSFGGRLVTQNGTTNLYLSYGKRTRKGNDLFILFGDPNSETTKRAITIKLVRSF